MKGWQAKPDGVVYSPILTRTTSPDKSGTPPQEENRELQTKINQLLKLNFRPEFLNLLDETVIFHALSDEKLVKIVDIQLTNLEKKLAEKRIKLEVKENF